MRSSSDMARARLRRSRSKSSRRRQAVRAITSDSARRYFQHHRAGRRGQLHARAEHGFPGRERQIEVEVVPADAVEWMRMQGNVEIEIAVASAVHALASLAWHAQPLAVGSALGDAG